MTPKRLLRSCHSTLKSIFCFFMADPRPTSLPFFPSEDKTHDVDSWAALALNSDTLPTSQMYKVSKVSFCKCISDKDHEFLIVILRCGDTTTFFITDRGLSSNASWSYSSLPSAPQTPSSSTYDVSALKRNKLPLAKDQVYTPKFGSGDIKIFTEQKIGPYVVLSTLMSSTNTNTMNAAQLVVLLRTVSELRRHYDVLAHQCYWYSNSIFQTIKSAAQFDETLGPNVTIQGKFYLLPVVKNETKKCVGASDIVGELAMQSITHGEETVREYSDNLAEGPRQREEDVPDDFGVPSTSKLSKYLSVKPGSTPEPADVRKAYIKAVEDEEVSLPNPM